MLDRERLKQQAILLLVLCVFTYQFDQTISVILALAGIILFALYLGLKPTVMHTFFTRDLFVARENVIEFEARMREDEAFRNAIIYVHSLSTDDFLLFSRLAIELRDKSNSKVLGEVASYFRRKQ